jgi:hypothetical protein
MFGVSADILNIYFNIHVHFVSSQPEKAMGMLSYAEKNIFSIGKSGEKGENKDKEESISDDPLKTKLSLVCYVKGVICNFTSLKDDSCSGEPLWWCNG